MSDELKKAKVDVALIGVKLKKVQKQLEASPDDQELKDKIATFETDLTAAQALLAKLGSSAPAAPAPKAALSDELKKLKIDAAIAKASVKKVEKALKKAEEIQAPEIEGIRQQLKEAQQRADDLEKALANPSSIEPAKATLAPSTNADADKKRKMDLAVAKAGIKKAEKNMALLKEQGKDDAEIAASEWPQKLAEAQAKLTALESQASELKTESVASEKSDLAEQIKKQKIAAALAKAQINKLKKRLESTPEEAESIQQEIAATQKKQEEAEALLAQLTHSQDNTQENR